MTKLSHATAVALAVRPSRYQHLIDQIVAGAGEYVAVPLADLGGDHVFIAQSRLLQFAKRRGLRITTTSRAPGVLYARLLLDQVVSQ